MGKPVRIVSLAEDLIRLSGLEPGRDIPIVFTGVRPGEKLSEQLWEDETVLRPTTHPDILRLTAENHIWKPGELNRTIDSLSALAEKGEVPELIGKMNQIVDGNIGQTPPPELTSV
jgi:FlaA1/EpsC-like NDP-sugar epimerase